MTYAYGKELSDWFDNQRVYGSRTELATSLGIPRETFNSYLRGESDLRRVNPDNLRKLYELTGIESFNIESVKGSVFSRENDLGKQSKLEKYAFNPAIDARRISADIIEVAVSLHPYLVSSNEERKKLIDELKQRGGEALAYLNQLVGILEQDGDITQWKTMANPPNDVKSKLEERYK